MSTQSRLIAAVVGGSIVLGVSACSEETDPLEVQQSVSITDVRDETNSDYYSVRTPATLAVDGVSTRLILGFDVTNTNQTKFSPASTVHFPDGSSIVCEAGDPRRVRSLSGSLDTWDFECEPGAFPEVPMVLTSASSTNIADPYCARAI